MPAKNINLLGKVDFEKTPVGKFLRWSLTYGRYIIICTEIIVLLAFTYRFTLDRRITDLNEEIAQKSAIIEANQGFETQFRNLQSRVGQVGTLVTQPNVTYELLKHLEQITPPGVLFKMIGVADQRITIDATADTNASLALFVAKLKSSPLLTSVSIGTLSKTSTGTAIASFKVDAVIRTAQISSQTSTAP